MKKLGIILILGAFVISSAMALDETKCPRKFTFTINSLQVYKTSIYDDIEGWEQMQDKLSTLSENIDLTFYRSYVKEGACSYKISGDMLKGSYAQLAERDGYDYDSGKTYKWNRMQITLMIEKERFYMFFPIESFDQDGMLAPDYDDTVKIAASLNKRLYDFGVIGFSIK